jgi:hypothetical protein
MVIMGGLINTYIFGIKHDAILVTNTNARAAINSPFVENKDFFKLHKGWILYKCNANSAQVRRGGGSDSVRTHMNKKNKDPLLHD